MGSMHNNQPSFVKFLSNENYKSQIRLPTFFVTQNINILPENAMLKISSGEKWDVRLEKLDDDEYYFTQGWDKFIEDLKVQLFELLVFWFNPDTLTFNVLSYGLHGCNNELDSNPALCFKMVLKYYQASRLILPRRFFKASGLINKRTVVLEYFPTRRTKVVKLDHRNPTRSDLALGWGAFRKENDIVNGKTYLFEFVSSKNVILVKDVNGVGEKRSVENEAVALSDEEEEEESKPDVSRLNRKAAGCSVDKGKRVAEEISDRIVKTKRSKSRTVNEGGSDLYFEIHHLMEYQRKRLAFPKSFMVASGLDRKGSVEVEYIPTHRHQVVKLNHTHRYRSTTATGWSEFLKANGIVVDRSYSLEFNRDRNVIQMNELKNVHNASGSGKTRSRAHVVEYDSTSSSDEETDVSPNTSADDDTSNTEYEFSVDEAHEANEIDSARSKPHIADEEDVYFEVTLRTKCCQSRLSIPVKFVRGARLMGKASVKLEYLPTNRFQDVTLVHRQKYITEMALGWSKFRKTNGLKDRKRYSFKFNPITSVIQVEEVKKVHIGSGDQNAEELETFPREVKSEKEEDDYVTNRHGEGCSSVDRTWRFSKELTATHFSDRMSIPISFAKGTGMEKNRNIKLLDGKGKKWPVTITDRNLGTFAMTAGWRDFLAGNNVVVGDTILFEYVQNPDNIVEATVLKSSTKK